MNCFYFPALPEFFAPRPCRRLVACSQAKGSLSHVHRQKDFRVAGVVLRDSVLSRFFFLRKHCCVGTKIRALDARERSQPRPELRSRDLNLEAVTWKLQMYLSCLFQV